MSTSSDHIVALGYYYAAAIPPKELRDKLRDYLEERIETLNSASYWDSSWVQKEQEEFTNFIEAKKYANVVSSLSEGQSQPTLEAINDSKQIYHLLQKVHASLLTQMSNSENENLLPRLFAIVQIYLGLGNKIASQYGQYLKTELREAHDSEPFIAIAKILGGAAPTEKDRKLITTYYQEIIDQIQDFKKNDVPIENWERLMNNLKFDSQVAFQLKVLSESKVTPEKMTDVEVAANQQLIDFLEEVQKELYQLYDDLPDIPFKRYTGMLWHLIPETTKEIERQINVFHKCPAFLANPDKDEQGLRILTLGKMIAGHNVSDAEYNQGIEFLATKKNQLIVLASQQNTEGCQQFKDESKKTAHFIRVLSSLIGEEKWTITNAEQEEKALMRAKQAHAVNIYSFPKETEDAAQKYFPEWHFITNHIANAYYKRIKTYNEYESNALLWTAGLDFSGFEPFKIEEREKDQ
ncbi:hypothetical protein SAMN05444392_106130 [Seinonella peptonophila]|uniref:Uncharacterized protein n=1 Tax=Seinonella peptonophila TaxID=112248 RepID=A0A1M4YA32_9BACL|nr:hypothetical protein [Seinonella peptonophila]SHF02661.1 hypothetical protein SAMN05444392_106130 [Seinonella peptonophila]